MDELKIELTGLHRHPISQTISGIFNPVVTTFLSVFFALVISEGVGNGWLLAVLLFNLIMPLLLVGWAIKQNVPLDDEVTNQTIKRSRLAVIIPLAGLFLIESTVALTTGQPQPLTAILVGLTILTLIFAAISYFWKISHHMEGASLLAAISLLFYGLNLWWTALLLPIIAFSRLRLNRHTPLQLLAGAILPPVVILPIVWAFGLI